MTISAFLKELLGYITDCEGKLSMPNGVVTVRNPRFPLGEGYGAAPQFNLYALYMRYAFPSERDVQEWRLRERWGPNFIDLYRALRCRDLTRRQKWIKRQIMESLGLRRRRRLTNRNSGV